MVELSMEISRQINEVTDIMLENLTACQDEVLADPIFQDVVYRHCPQILLDKFKDRILSRLPKAHQIAILSAYIASFIVYREGLGWMDGIPTEGRYDAARTYMHQDVYTNRLIDSVQASNLPDRDKIASILRMSATRDLTILEMERRVAEIGGSKG